MPLPPLVTGASSTPPSPSPPPSPSTTLRQDAPPPSGHRCILDATLTIASTLSFHYPPPGCPSPLWSQVHPRRHPHHRLHPLLPLPSARMPLPPLVTGASSTPPSPSPPPSPS